MLNNVVALAGFALVGLVLLLPRIRRAESWRATVTPLASIIGSGFLVSLPILALAFGALAPVAMAVLVGVSYLVGAAVRFNIRHGEALFDDMPGSWINWLEQASHLALALAYFVSVTYYLSLLGVFAVKGAGGAPGPEHVLAARCVATGLLAFIAGWGALRGLRGLEGVEELAVGFKLAVIAAVLAALAALNVEAAAGRGWSVPVGAHKVGLHELRVLLGMLIVVQGFETSRFLRSAYPAKLRIRTMKWSQWLSAAIYCAFFLLSLLILDRTPGQPDAAAVTDMMAPAASVLPAMLIAGAVFAQLSAAVADAIGGAGLIEETTSGRLGARAAYPVIAVMGILIVWSTDVFQVIAIASRAFALYYALQCGVAVLVALRAPDVRSRLPAALGFAALGLLMVCVLLFGLPAEAGG
ncbi:MAG: hypothetical protein GC201_01375 [Alphaproteobacteria bacterium]|nr:hypothetical protein [Alphaproteobacteria bacterium]